MDPVVKIDMSSGLVQSVPCEYGMFTCHLLDATLFALQHVSGRTELLESCNIREE